LPDIVGGRFFDIDMFAGLERINRMQSMGIRSWQGRPLTYPSCTPGPGPLRQRVWPRESSLSAQRGRFPCCQPQSCRYELFHWPLKYGRLIPQQTTQG
jgi:hypothetical protein